MQLVVAGKAHPMDGRGKRDVRAWAELAAEPRIRRRLVFLEDYDLTMAQELVRGVDAGQLYRILEEEAVPEFYSRDAKGLPRSWIARMRASISWSRNAPSRAPCTA